VVLYASVVTVDPQKDDAGHRPRLSKDQVAEILVLGEQQPIFVLRAFHDFRVGCTRCDL
jgi:hypothetical protein